VRDEERRMNQQQQSRTRRQVLWTIVIAITVLLLISISGGYVLEWQWTGIVEANGYPKRTLWDWLQLLIIPAVLAGGGLWFNRQQRKQELEITDSRAQDEALRAYLDQIGQLLLDKERPLRQAKEGDEVRTLARARTLTVLARLDGGRRKGSVMQFLYESGLITKEGGVVSLKGADLSRANLNLANLSEADLSETDLNEASLIGADLRRADLRMAFLADANLNIADLRGPT
jgi:hypothetical protein